MNERIRELEEGILETEASLRETIAILDNESSGAQSRPTYRGSRVAGDINVTPSGCMTSTVKRAPIPKAPAVMPEVFDGRRDSWRDYLEHFNSCSEVNGWTDKKKCEFFAVRLRGVAQQVDVDLPTHAKQDFYAITNAFSSHFEPEALSSVVRAQLRGRVRNSGESLSALGSSIRRDVNRAYSDLTTTAKEELSCDFFINALPEREFRVLVRQGRPRTLTDALGLAIELDAIERAEGTVRGDRFSRGVGTLVEGGGSRHTDPFGGELLGRMNRMEQQLALLVERDRARTCPLTTPVPVPPLPMQGNVNNRIQCWNCGQFGHVRGQCPNPWVPQAQGN